MLHKTDLIQQTDQMHSYASSSLQLTTSATTIRNQGTETKALIIHASDWLNTEAKAKRSSPTESVVCHATVCYAAVSSPEFYKPKTTHICDL
ncbi:hypothetical protein Nepgr_005777 [Nepenthes gracilis]|uniref:Uncharacterized protein n=1 Tax=Nepenthes gracilis TaxID=150966 RepID=A0AAD3S3T6_NEPGR|nr:hypothetical protein Nepgr_005777 [Nepenthes gracilis]